MVYTVTINPALDYVLKIDEFRPDDINRATSAEIYYGGKGINVSVVLSRLGIDNIALGFVGGFSGKKLCDLLSNEDIKTDFTETKCGDTRINVKIKAESEIDINADGVTVNQDEINDLLCKLDSINDGDFLVIAGSVPRNLPKNIYEQILEKTSEKNVKIIIDTSDKALFDLLKFKPFLIKPNHHELGSLFGIEINTENEIIKYAKKLQTMGAENVLVSRAENGAILIDKDGKIHLSKSAKGTLINSVGCGDSMIAGFIAGFIEKNDYNYALKLATACGGATAFCDSLADKEEIYSIFEKM